MNIFWLLTLLCIGHSTAFLDPVSIVAGVVIAAAGAGLVAHHQYWKWKECCRDEWVRHSVASLATELQRHLFGQHIVQGVVSKAITAHVNDQNPKKALVLSFHGQTGTGKNYVADVIARALYKNGLDSLYVHKFIASHLYTDKSRIEMYKSEIRHALEQSVKMCDRSLFIFDEIDKMPKGLSSVLRPYLDYHDKLNGLDFRKSIFIFLSNIAGEKLNNYTVRHFKDRTHSMREDISIRDMDRFLSVHAFNHDGGLNQADIIVAGLIDFFVPFLPLERKHVKMCIEAEIVRKNITCYRTFGREQKKIMQELKDKVADELHYFPEDSRIFSAKGCKRVSKKLEVYTPDC